MPTIQVLHKTTMFLQNFMSIACQFLLDALYFVSIQKLMIFDLKYFYKTIYLYIHIWCILTVSYSSRLHIFQLPYSQMKRNKERSLLLVVVVLSLFIITNGQGKVANRIYLISLLK